MDFIGVKEGFKKHPVSCPGEYLDWFGHQASCSGAFVIPVLTLCSWRRKGNIIGKRFVCQLLTLKE